MLLPGKRCTNVELDSTAAARPVEAASAHVLSNVKSVFNPPESLQLWATPDHYLMKRHHSIAAAEEGGKEVPSPETSSPTHSSPSSSSLNEEEERLFPATPDTGESATPATEVPISLPALHELASGSLRSSSSSTHHTQSSGRSIVSVREGGAGSASGTLVGSSADLAQEHRPLSAEPSLDKNVSGRSSPALSRTISISSVFSRTGSLAAGGHSSSGDSASSFLDRFTSEAKEVAREAKAAAAEASKAAIEATKKDQRTQKLLHNLQSNLEPMKSGAKELWRKSQDSRDAADVDVNPSVSSVMSSMSSDFNGLADKTSSMFSGLFANKAASLAQQVKWKAQPLSDKLQHGMSQNASPGTHRRGLVENTSLIRHSTSAQSRNASQASKSPIEGKSAHNENQNFLKEVVDAVLDGNGVGWLKLARVRKLVEDENYRTLVVTRLNKGIDCKVGPDDHMEDVCVPKPVWKGMLKLLNAVVAGLEASFEHNGLGGMASALFGLEIAHTHYWAKDLTDDGKEENQSSITSTASVSQVTSPFGSVDNLHRLTSSLTPADPVPSSTAAPVSVNISDSGGSDSSTRRGSEQVEQPGTEIVISGCRCADADAVSLNPSYFSAARLSQHSCRSTYSDSELAALQGRQTRTSSVWSNKSSVSTGYRYHAGSLIGSAGFPVDAPRTYLFQGMIGKERSRLWDEMQFWEDAFLDAVSQEREVVGMDQGPGEMMERYRSLSDVDRRRLEAEEDRLLSTVLYNMVAFMVMVNANQTDIKRKIRRLLGKCHIGLIYSAEINGLLDQLENLHGNDIDLKPLTSRQMHRQTFSLHMGTDSSGEMVFMEVRDDGLILRSISGTIIERWWYERLVNMTYSPKNKVLCLWRRVGGQTQLHKYYTKKCKELYHCIKESMERAAARGAGAMPGKLIVDPIEPIAITR